MAIEQPSALRETKRVNVLEQIKKLDEQRASLLANAKKEALDKAQAAIAELNSLGFSYTLQESVKGKKATRNTDPAKKHCPICDMDGHDGRVHRSQDPKKKFTAKELQEKGLA